jgi:hypothetical protein
MKDIPSMIKRMRHLQRDCEGCRSPDAERKLQWFLEYYGPDMIEILFNEVNELNMTIGLNWVDPEKAEDFNDMSDPWSRRAINGL